MPVPPAHSPSLLAMLRVARVAFLTNTHLPQSRDNNIHPFDIYEALLAPISTRLAKGEKSPDRESRIYQSACSIPDFHWLFSNLTGFEIYCVLNNYGPLSRGQLCIGSMHAIAALESFLGSTHSTRHGCAPVTKRVPSSCQNGEVS